jgi:general secretion pathway protein A
MYEQFYGLKENPFNLTPDPKFLYLSETHEESFAHLLYGIERKRGFIVLTGETGTGKTTLLNSLVQRLEQPTRIAFLVNPNIDILDIYKYIFYCFHVTSSAATKGEFLIDLQKFLMRCLHCGENPVVIVDEAQNLSHEFLEDLRLLSNFETPQEKLLQIALVGHPELDKKLNSPQLYQLKQRIGTSYKLLPLSFNDTKSYIESRLSIAGSSERIFSEAAIHEIYSSSQGVPRVINVLCDLALFLGYADKKREINPVLVRQAAESLDIKTLVAPSGQSRETTQALGAAADELIIKKSKNPGLLSFPEGTSAAGTTPWIEPGSPWQRPRKQRRRSRLFSLSMTAAILFVLGFGVGSVVTLRQRPGEPLVTSSQGMVSQEQAAVPAEILPSHEGSGGRPGSQGQNVSQEAQPVGRPEPAGAPEDLQQVVLAQPGDSLARIMLREYGRFDAALLARIKAANPAIADPAHIKIGQKIVLPRFSE